MISKLAKIIFFKKKDHFFYFFFFLFTINAFAEFLSSSISIENSSNKNVISGIDAIYLININRRKDKLDRCVEQLNFYNLNFSRVEAIDGKFLSEETINTVGLVFKKEMISGLAKINLSSSSLVFLNEDHQGKTCFYHYLTKGALGCALSHISILEYAYKLNLNTIWVLEDDFFIEKSPFLLKDALKDLDLLLESKEWDILFTDDYHYFNPFNDYLTSLFWRPDFFLIKKNFLEDHKQKIKNYNLSEKKNFSLWEKIDRWQMRTLIKTSKSHPIPSAYPDCLKDFRPIKGRFAIHSMIIRRSGMIKILSHIKRYGIFLPYDDELAFIPGLKMFNLKDPIVTMAPLGRSDTDSND